MEKKPKIALKPLSFASALSKSKQEKKKVEIDFIQKIDSQADVTMDQSVQEKFHFNFKDVTKQKEIGNGVAGKVYTASIKGIDRKLALKIILLQSNQAKMRELLINEVKVHTNSKHKNIIKCYASKYVETDKSVQILLEYMDKGSLGDLLKTKPKFETKQLQFIAKQLVEGLNYMHREVRAMHRDLKPANILLNTQGSVKIADFGVSGILKDSVDTRNTMIGSFLYMSPERIQNNEYGFESDIWSLGLILLECALGYFPYDTKQRKASTVQLFDFLKMCDQAPVFKGIGLSEDFESFLECCLETEPSKRKETRELLDHPFICKNVCSQGEFKQWLSEV